jgi:hypothetical protein
MSAAHNTTGRGKHRRHESSVAGGLSWDLTAAYARYIGRVGALALALGVGVAVATGGTGLAAAQTDSSSDSTGADAQTQASTSPDGATANAGSDTSQHSEGDDSADGADISDTDVDDQAGTALATSGVDTSTNDAGQSTDTGEETASGDDGSKADDVLDGGHESGGHDSGSAPDNSGVAVDEVNEDSDDQVPEPVLSTGGYQVVQDSGGDGSGSAALRHLRVARGGENTPRTDVDENAAPRLMAASVVEDAPAPNPVQSLLAIPGAAISVATTLVSAVLSPFLAPGPSTPAEPPFLWALLGWVNREIQRTFFNRTPNAGVDEVTTSEDGAKVIDVLTNDTDGDDDELTVTEVTQPINGTVTINDDGTLTYTPKANFSGADTFTYTVSDSESRWHIHGLAGLLGGLFGGDGGHTATGTVNVTVTAVNDAPVAVDDTADTPEDAAVTINVLANDSDIDGDALTVASGDPRVVVNADNTITFTPAANSTGTQTFTYTVSDSKGGADDGAVTVTVSAVNDAPMANTDSYTTAEDTALTIHAPGVLGNDTDVDGDDLSVSVIGIPAHGGVTVNADGSFTYTPTMDYNGDDEFSYTVTDGSLTSSTTVKITVTPVNDAPVAVDDTADTPEDAPVTINVLANDSDVDGDALTVASGDPRVVVNADNTITFTPTATGVQTFGYTVSDGHGGSDTATVSVTVSTVVQPGIVINGPTDIDPNTEQRTYQVTATGLDTSTLTLSADPQHGFFVDNGDGTFTYKPDREFVKTLAPIPGQVPVGTTGSDTFTVTATDASGKRATADVTATIHYINNPPILQTFIDKDGTPDDPRVIGHFVFDAVDQNGDPVTMSLMPKLERPAKGTLEYFPDTKTFIFTPTPEARAAASVPGAPFNDIQVQMQVSITDGFRNGTVNTGISLFIAPLLAADSGVIVE